MNDPYRMHCLKRSNGASDMLLQIPPVKKTTTVSHGEDTVKHGTKQSREKIRALCGLAAYRIELGEQPYKVFAHLDDEKCLFLSKRPYRLFPSDASTKRFDQRMPSRHLRTGPPAL